MTRVHCPWCARTLFWSHLPWVACTSEDPLAVISIRCTRKWRCGRIVALRILAVPHTVFESEAARLATIDALETAIALKDGEPCSR